MEKCSTVDNSLLTGTEKNAYLRESVKMVLDNNEIPFE